jgi:integrase
MTDIVPHRDAALARLEELDEETREYRKKSRADNTKRAYQSDWRHFCAWCEEHHLVPLPAEIRTVERYVTLLAKRCKVATLERRLASISQAHRLAGLASPTAAPEVHLLMDGIRRDKGTKQASKAAATVGVVREMVATLEPDLAGKRDRALLLVGFAGAFRRSELASLDVADIQYVPQGLVVTLRRSKTDQTGEGRKVGIPYGVSMDTCPVRSLKAWLDAAQITEGAIFRPIDRWGHIQEGRLTGHSVARVVKRAAEAAGLDPELFGGHSLRAGLATSAAAEGATERQIMQQTGHKSERMVRRYIRDGSLFRDNPAGKVGL